MGRKWLLSWVGLVLCWPLVASSAGAQAGCYRHQYLGNNPSDKRPGWHDDTNGISHDDTHWYVSQIRGKQKAGGLPRIWRIPVTHDLAVSVECGVDGVSCIDFTEAEWRDEPDRFLSYLLPPLDDVYGGYDHVGDLTWHRRPDCSDDPEVCPGFLFTAIEGPGQPSAIAVFRAVGRGDDSGSAVLQFIDHLPIEAYFWTGIDPFEGFVYTTARREGDDPVDTPFLKYQIDWDRLQYDLDLELDGEEPGPWKVHVLDESGNPLELRNLQGGAFSPDGKLLYITNGRDAPELPNRGINVFEVELADGRPCGMAPGDCWARRVDHSIRSSAGCSSAEPCAFVFEWHRGTDGTGQEPQGITFFDLDSAETPTAGGTTSLGKPVGGQVHAIMLDNNAEKLGKADQIFVKHYRLDRLCETPVGGIDVFPDAIDFGDVDVGSTSAARLRVANLSSADLTVGEIELGLPSDGFAIASQPTLPQLLASTEFFDVEVAFSPTSDVFPETATATASLAIQSDDPERPEIEVALAARAISLIDQVARLLDGFDDAVEFGELTGTGSGLSAEHRLEALRSMLEEAVSLLEGGFVNEACGQLHAALMHVDGEPVPEDFVEGPGAGALADDLVTVRTHLECPIPRRGCGMGFELALFLLPVWWYGSRRRSADGGGVPTSSH